MNTSTAWLIAILVLISCNDKKDPPPVKDNGRNDSMPRVNPERNVNPIAPVDVSPMDMSYYPVEYPKLKMSKAIDVPPLARVVYSRPHLQGRTLFVDLLKYGEPWRLGANEATELDLYADATIQDKKIKAGRYILYCIPQKNEWTIVLNSNIDTWGLEQDTTRDIARFQIPVNPTNRRIEYFTMAFYKAKSGANLLIAWDNWEARLPFIF